MGNCRASPGHLRRMQNRSESNAFPRPINAPNLCAHTSYHIFLAQDESMYAINRRTSFDVGMNAWHIIMTVSLACSGFYMPMGHGAAPYYFRERMKAWNLRELYIDVCGDCVWVPP